jgi:hypothetical protein
MITNAAKKPVYLAFLFVLSACESPGEKDMASCHAEALRANSRSQTGSELDEYQKSCMGAKGFRFSSIMPGCARGGDLYESPACYVRRDSN